MEFLLPNCRLAAPGLYRSAELGSVSPQLLADFAAQTGLKTVIDLRTVPERELSPEGQFPPGVALLSMPLFETELDWIAPNDRSPSAVAVRYFQMLENGLPMVRRIAELLHKTDAGPTLFHCAAGRDRTGIVIACMLASRGFSAQAIVADYVLSDGVNGVRSWPETMVEFLRLANSIGGTRAWSPDTGL